MSMTSVNAAIGALLNGYTGNPPLVAENKTPSKTVQNGEWVRVSIRPSDSFNSEVGATKERNIGMIMFQHFINEDGGTLPAYTFADKIGALFNEKTVATSGPGISGTLRFERRKLLYVGKIDGKVTHNVLVNWIEDVNAVNAA